MSFNFEGIEGFKIHLSRLAEIPNVADNEMKAIATEVAKKAKNMAPYDYKDLIGAIQVARRGAQGAGGRFIGGMSNYEVFINENHPVQDPAKRKAGVTHVRDYAWAVHEHMGWASNPTDFMPNAERNLGPNGEERGGRFLERALEDLRPGVYARISKKVLAYIGSLG